MLLAKNGKASSTKCTKHINIRYFFIMDRIVKGDLSIEWCPTRDMVGDYMTKPLQGALFRKFRDQIMGVTPLIQPGTDKIETKNGKLNARKDKQCKQISSLASPSKEQCHRSVLDQTGSPKKTMTKKVNKPKHGHMTNQGMITKVPRE